MDQRTQQLLGYPSTTPTVDQLNALSQLSEIGQEFQARIRRIAQVPNVDRAWVSLAQQQVTSGLMSLRQAVLPSASFEIYSPENQTFGIGQPQGTVSNQPTGR